MRIPLLRALSGALVIASSVPTGSANASQITRRLPVFTPAGKPAGLGARHISRSVRIIANGLTANISFPTGGCTGRGASSGVSNFVGGSGVYYPDFTMPTNFVYDQGNYDYDAVVSGEFNQACDTAGIVGAGSSNIIGDNSNANAGSSAILAGYSNGIDAETAFIGAGEANLIGLSDAEGRNNSAIVAGEENTIGASSDFIGAGQFNTVTTKSDEEYGQSAFVGAGLYNSVGGGFAGIVAGEYNSVGNDNAIIAGGARNTSTGFASFIGGGYRNTVSGYEALVSGGANNSASGTAAVIPGGTANVASGTDSFAAGTGSHAVNDGTFLWSDDSSNPKTLTSSGGNQFLARAAGGFALYSSADLSTGVKLAPGSGSWSTLSDRSSKTGISDVDDERILVKIASLPVSEWSYRAQGMNVRHLGPMAQDFRAAFGLGEDARHISTVDEEGVALAAIKALQSEVVRKDRQLTELQRSAQAMRAREAAIRHSDEQKFAALNDRLAALEHAVGQRARTSGQ